MQAKKDTLELDRLLRQGEAAARVGDRAEAETLLRKAVDEYPYSEDAYLALAGVVDDLQEKRAILLRVQHMNPASEEARLGLERIAAKLGTAPTEAAEGVEEVVCVCGSGRLTTLRCGKCGKPICPNCFVRHPVGLRCKECAQLRKSPIYNVSLGDYAKAGAVGLVLSVVAGAVAGSFGGFLGFFTLIIGVAVGGGIADLMSRVIRYKRGLGMQILAALCIIAGAGIAIFLPAIGIRAGFNLFYVIAAVIGAVGRLR